MFLDVYKSSNSSEPFSFSCFNVAFVFHISHSMDQLQQ